MRVTLSMALMLTLAASAAGCALDRSGLARGPAGGDAGRRDGGGAAIDGAIEEDAMASRDDAGPPSCTAPCLDGTECVGRSCECPAGACCPACPAFQVCRDSRCEMPVCGGIGQSCCDAGEPCIGGTCLDSTCTACGAVGQLCCTTGTACAGGGSCEGGYCLPGSCGNGGETCCPGSTCNPGHVCAGGMCSHCGEYGERCCAGGTCNSLICGGGGRCCFTGFC